MLKLLTNLRSTYAHSLIVLLPLAASAEDPHLWVGNDIHNGSYDSWGNAERWLDSDGNATVPGSGDLVTFSNRYFSLSQNRVRTPSIGSIQLDGNRTIEHIEFALSSGGSDNSMEIGKSGEADGEGSLYTLTLEGDSDNEIILFDTSSSGTYSAALHCPLAWSPSTGIVQFDNDAGTLFLNSSISGSNNLRIKGGGAVELHGDSSSYSGQIFVQGGSLAVRNSSALGSSTQVDVSSGQTVTIYENSSFQSISGSGALVLDSAEITTSLDSLASSVTGSGKVTHTGSSSYDQTIDPTAYTGDFEMDGSGSLILDFDGDYSGDLTLTSGTLDVAFGGTYTGTLTVGSGHLAIQENPGASGPAGGYFSDTATLDLTNFSLELGEDEAVGGLSGSKNLTLGGILTLGSNESETTYTAVISGTGGITKEGTSTLHLSGASTYTGKTIISSGRLKMNNGALLIGTSQIDVNGNLDGSALASSIYYLRPGQTMTGNGSVTGNLVIQQGAVLSPGDSIGSMDVSGDVTFNTNTIYRWQVSDWDGDEGVGYDQFRPDEFKFESHPDEKYCILRIAGENLVNFSETDKRFEIVNASQDITDFDDVTINIVIESFTNFAGSWSTEIDGDKLYLHYTAPDTTGPVITLDGASTVDVEVLTGSYTEPGAMAQDDEDGDVSDDIVIDSTAVNTNIVGAYQVTYDVQDSSSNDATTVIRTVNVIDTVDPVLSLSNHSGSGTVDFTLECGVDSYSDPGYSASDNYDGSLASSVVVGGDTVNTSALGEYTVSYSVTDSSGNTDTANRTITVVDTTDPVITLNGANPLTLECSVDSYSEAGVALVSDACDTSLTTVDVSINDSDVDEDEVGTYYVYYTLVDSSGNSTTVSREVQVVDTIAPAVTLNGDDPMEVECNIDSYSEQGASLSDTCDDNPTLNISGSVDAGTKGQYILSYTGTDASGNTTSPAVTRTVNIVDTTAPTINLTGFSQVSIVQNGTYNDPGATANDACDGDLTSSIQTDTSAIMPSTLGSYSVLYSVDDAEGNTGFNSREVLVTGDATWTGATDSAWIESGNWDLNTVIPGSVSTVTFDGTASTFSVNVDGEVYANDLVFNSATDYTLSDGVLQLTSGDITVSTTSGTHTISGTLSSLDPEAGSVIDIAGSSELVLSGMLELFEFEKRGSGTMTLSGSTLGASVDITAGTVELTDDSEVNGGDWNIAAGATFDVSALSSTFSAETMTFSGNGTINGPIALEVASEVRPGTSAGQLTTGALEFKSESTYEWEISDWTGVKGTDWDHINSSGTVTFSANEGSKMRIRISSDSLINFTDVTASFEILSASSISGFDASAIELDTTGFTTGTGYWVVSQNGNSILLTYTTPGVTVTLGSVSVASDDGSTILVEGDLTTGDTIVVTGPSSTTEPLFVELEYDDTVLMFTYTDPNIQEPFSGRLEIMFDSTQGFPSTVNLDVFAIDNPETDGDTTSAISILYSEIGEGFPPPEPIIYESTFVLEILDDDTPLAIWAAGHGLTLGVDAGPDDNPDGDDYDNRFEFAFMLDPNAPDLFSSVTRIGTVDVSSADYFYMTLPVRSSATFNENGVMTAEVDGVTYTITGYSDLLTTVSSLVEESPAITTDLPSLERNYTYKSFRFLSDVHTATQGFIRAAIE